MKSLLIMDWLAKLCLLLPIFLTGRSLGTMVGCLTIGLLAWLWFSVLLARAAKEHEDFFDTVSRLGGRGSAWLVYLIGLLYFLSHTAVCMSFCADLARTYLLPEVPLAALVLLPLIAGLYLAYSGIEVRGRVGEFLAPIVLFFFLFMAAAAVPGMNLPENGQTLLKADRRFFAGGYEVFAAVGGMFLPVLAVYLPDKEKNFGKSIRRAACWSLIPAGILLFITAGSFGTEGMLAFAFPGIRVMSNVAVPGGFIQRWDVLFLSLLLFSLAVSVGSGFWYLDTIAERLWNEAAEYRLACRRYRERTESDSWEQRGNGGKKRKERFGKGTGISGREAGSGRGTVSGSPAMPGQPAIVSAAIENASGLALHKWQQELAEEFGADGTGMMEFSEEEQNEDKNETREPSEEKKPNEGRSGLFILQGALAFAAFCAAGGFRSAESAVIYYRAYNLYVLTPVMLVVYLMLYFRGKQKRVKTAALCLLLCLLLTGCTARELEDRMFPMALEIRADDGILTMIYAWNGESNSGSGGGSRSKEQGTVGGNESEEQESAAGGENKEQETTGGSESKEQRAIDGNESEEQKTAGGNESEEQKSGGEGKTADIGFEPREEGNLTIFHADSLKTIQKQVEEYGDRYIDYSHVKAIIWDENLNQYPELEREIYEWLAADPAFAANLIIYPARESGLTLKQVDERSDGEIGVYLENLYRNNQKLREAAATLGKMTAGYYRGNPALHSAFSQESAGFSGKCSLLFNPLRSVNSNTSSVTPIPPLKMGV